MTVALETIGLHRRFGALVVANDIHFRLEAGARHALIGPNGAGKTTFVNLITGRLAPSAGRILLGGDDITKLSQAARVRRGLARTFQINTLFRGLSVLENVGLAVGEHDGIGGDMLRGIEDRILVLIEAQREISEITAARPTAEFDSVWGHGYVTGAHFTRMALAGMGLVDAPAAPHVPAA